jgi:MoxR-like ATPase
MLCNRLEYPTLQEEKEVLRRNSQLGIRRQDRGAVARTEFDVLEHEPVGTSDDLVRAMEAVHEIHVSETFTDHVVQVVARTRNHPKIELGCSPRAGIALIKGARARALLHARHYVIPEDMFALSEDVMLHRMRLTYEALAEGWTGQDVLQEILTDFGAAPESNGRARRFATRAR